MVLSKNHLHVADRLVIGGNLKVAAGCGKQIWNAGDLAEWVRNQAVEQGCKRESIELAEWYASDAGRNDWHGSCLKGDNQERTNFSINVDSVWKPSSDK